MIRADQFDRTKVLASAFAGSGPLNPTNAMLFMLQQWSSTYDGGPISLPGMLPPEVPSVILQSADGSRLADVSQERINVFWQRVPDHSVPELHELCQEFGGQLRDIFAQQNVRIGRLAAGMLWEAPAAAPGVELARQFCRDHWLAGPLNGLSGFELHAHRIYRVTSDLEVNSWVRIRTQLNSSGKYDAVSVEQDLNSLADEQSTRMFDSEDIAAFYGAVPGAFRDILKQYFPANDQEVYAQ